MLSIVVPTYKEAENLSRFTTAVRSSLNTTEYELIIVDDNSPDGTGEVAEALAYRYGNIKVIHRERKLGVASAIAEGVKIASGDVIGTLNVDMQHPPQLLPLMLEQARGHDIVIASRYIDTGHNKGSFWRGLVSRGAGTIAHLLLPRIRSVKDTMSGFFLFKKEVITDTQVLSTIPSGNISIGAKFLLQLLVKGHYDSVVEVPYTFEKRKGEKSKFSLRDYFAYLSHVFHLMMASGEFERIVKFCIVGGSGVGINLGLLFLLTDKLGLLYLISAVLSWMGAVLSNFALNDLWTFRDLRKQGFSNIPGRVLRFGAVRLIGLAMNLAILYCLTEFLGIYYILSALVAIIIVMIWNYVASLNLVWKK